MRTWLATALTLVLGLALGFGEASAQRGGGAAGAGAAAGRAGGAAPERRAANMRTIVRPIEAADEVWMEEMTILEIRDALAAGVTNVIILTGGVEQNGPYLPSGKHNYVLSAMGGPIARRMGNTLVAPVVTLEPGNTAGTSPGSTFVSQETYRAILRDMATSLKSQGFKNIFMMGDSGGNQGAMNAVATELNTAWNGEGARVHYIEAYYREDIWSCNFIKNELKIVQLPDDCSSATRDLYHDDYHYSSIVATTNPNRIRYQQREKVGLLHINSAPLGPIEQTIANGKKLIEYRTDITVRAMRAAMGGS